MLEDMGISVKSAGIGVQRDKFYFVNLNADPIMSELLVCYLKVYLCCCYFFWQLPSCHYHITAPHKDWSTRCRNTTRHSTERSWYPARTLCSRGQ